MFFQSNVNRNNARTAQFSKRRADSNRRIITNNTFAHRTVVAHRTTIAVALMFMTVANLTNKLTMPTETRPVASGTTFANVVIA
jgi:hypothetical protein